jgi:hypothetical protein
MRNRGLFCICCFVVCCCLVFSFYLNFSALLEGSMLGGKMAGGGCGVSLKDEIILIHNTIDMLRATQDTVINHAPAFVEMVHTWRKTV